MSLDTWLASVITAGATIHTLEWDEHVNAPARALILWQLSHTSTPVCLAFAHFRGQMTIATLIDTSMARSARGGWYRYTWRQRPAFVPETWANMNTFAVHLRNGVAATWVYAADWDRTPSVVDWFLAGLAQWRPSTEFTATIPDGSGSIPERLFKELLVGHTD